MGLNFGQKVMIIELVGKDARLTEVEVGRLGENENKPPIEHVFE